MIGVHGFFATMHDVFMKPIFYIIGIVGSIVEFLGVCFVFGEEGSGTAFKPKMHIVERFMLSGELVVTLVENRRFEGATFMFATPDPGIAEP